MPNLKRDYLKTTMYVYPPQTPGCFTYSQMFSVQCTSQAMRSSRSLRLVNHSPVCRKAEIQTVPGCRPKPFWGVRRAPRAPHALCACNMRSAHVHALRACGGALRAPPPKKVENEIFEFFRRKKFCRIVRQIQNFALERA